MKKHTTDFWGVNAPPAYVGNGLMGLRIKKNPFEDVSMLAAGFTAIRPCFEVEAPVYVPAPQMLFSVDGTPVAPEVTEQSYDFSNGELCTVARLRDITVKYLLFSSRSAPSLLISRLEFSGEPCRLTMELSYTIREKYRSDMANMEVFDPNEQRDGKCKITSPDGTSSLGICYRIIPVRGSVEKPVREQFATRAEIDVTAEGTVFDLITSYVPSPRHSEPHNQAQRMINLAQWQGFDRLRAQNRDTWAKIWESRIVIEGAKEGWQDALDASYFYLMCSMHPSSPFPVGPYGLSDRCYEGHAFWDTESFMFMYPLLCAPDTARTMLDYRFARLEAARNNARINGYRGIQFPWQSGVTGDEVTVPWATEAGEHHVNLDVAMAFDAFARVSGDTDFLREMAWPVMRGVAEWIESRVEQTERGYEILHITGIDEETPDVNNDSYSNIMAAKVLRTAAEYANKLGNGMRKRWLEIADGLYIPTRDGVLLQYEGQPESDCLHPAPLTAYFPYGYTAGKENDRKTLAHFIPRMEKYARYPMLSAWLGIFPAWLGDAERSLDYYDKTFLTFFAHPFYACTEFRIEDAADRYDPKVPLHTSFITSRGALLMGLAMGLTKLCPFKGTVEAPIEEWLGEGITLPAGWTKLTVGRIYLRGKAYRLTAEQGAKRAVLEELE